MSFCLQRQQLTSGWQFQQLQPSSSSGSTRGWRSARPPPTTIHLDLLDHGAIPDYRVAKNEDEVQWVGESAWAYRTIFSVPSTLRHDKNVRKVIVIEGLDTYASVKLDGKLILTSDNMFLGHRVDITDHMSNTQAEESESHMLEITFDNAERRGDQVVEQHPEHNWTTFNSGLARLAARKAQYHWGWDWGPRVLTCGPWKPIYLEYYEAGIIDLAVSVVLSDDLEQAKLHVSLETSHGQGIVDVEVKFGALTVIAERVTISSAMTNLVFNLARPRLWWPHTFGAQPLYHVTAMLRASSSADSIILDSMRKRIGIRRIELVRHRFAESAGSSFFFKINNEPIYSAGSNWIPHDLLLPRVTDARYRQWVELAKASNQVMVRVWGGGVYESDSFYDACDELGILVWQDFMFACGMFPVFDKFQESVKLEAEQNVRALRHHPSIALWCGNNEDYIIPLLSQIEYDPNETDIDAVLKSPFPARVTYEYTLPEICQRLTPGTPYWAGSPFGGAMPNTTEEGDVHQWHVWHLEKFPYQDFPKLSGRFVSEFGMQGMPCFETAQEFFPASDRLEDGRDYSDDEYVLFHNKCDGGQDTLQEYCTTNLNVTTTSLRRYIYLTQLIQSETTATAFRSWRRDWRGPGKEYCGGALIWQLNDCYPVTSWAMVDVHLRPKMAFWALKRENKPITAGIARVEADGKVKLELWAVNTSLTKVKADIVLRAWSIRSGAKLLSKSIHRDITLRANQSTELGVVDVDGLKINSSETYRDIAFALDLVATDASILHDGRLQKLAHGRTLSQSINFHEPLKVVPFTPPTTFKVELFHSKGQVMLQVESSAVLKGVYIETDDVDTFWPEDNGFDMMPHEPLIIAVGGLDKGDEGRLRITWLGGEWRGMTDVALVKSSL